MTITTEQALEIAQQAGLDTFYKTANESARMTVGTHENFTKALNQAAAMALENEMESWISKGLQRTHYHAQWLQRASDEYRQAGEAA